MISKTDNRNYVYAANIKDIESAGGCLSVTVQKHAVAIFIYDSKISAVDNRCPHMGFPLNQGTVKDGILTCHWHHARFDLTNGGTFDQWAGDVTSFPVEIRNQNEVWIDIPYAIVGDADSYHYHQALLENGLKRNIPLMIAKTVIAMLGDSARSKRGANEKEMLDAFRIQTIRLGSGLDNTYLHDGHYSLS
jgi:nitrite reductase/ring-hydroxylating ferredoxin subunit